ncbi:hypothetical protein LG634_24640 [Streptomyces bambusae]|uniref:hypothetical protein n=1 Tax=Streptomyces bambusae TaxID=1550616 RepID=UPI001CFDAFA6|nr:hypothetical protein [Streptomyces bambusae]MCB5168002.1 hypothetical protein [Streptomyces bambusae]
MITINSPESGFSGEVAGVQFSRGEATLDPGAGGATAALAYFHRRGYRITDSGTVREDPAEPDPHADDAFDPAAHTVAEVIAYLNDADDDERARVLAAEEAGEARATILKKGAAS